MLKYIGCAVTVASAAIWGFEKSCSLKKSVLLTEALRDLVKRTGDDIDMLCRPLGEIFGSYSDSLLSQTGFMAELNENGFQKALMSVQNLLPEEALEILLPFAKRLGGGDREAETALCRRTAALLSELCEKLREKLPEKTKMYRALPLLCALSAVILII